jgi:hypothetical protein
VGCYTKVTKESETTVSPCSTKICYTIAHNDLVDPKNCNDISHVVFAFPGSTVPSVDNHWTSNGPGVDPSTNFNGDKYTPSGSYDPTDNIYTICFTIPGVPATDPQRVTVNGVVKAGNCDVYPTVQLPNWPTNMVSCPP